ncbi:MAG: putative inorganic carbon ((-)) transporter, partial [bacterium]
PFLEAAANGLALYGCLVASIVAAYFADSRRWRHAALAVAALCALGILLTLTRAVWLSASIASVAALLCARETRRFVLPTVIAGVALVVLAFAAVPGLSDSARARARERTPVYDRRNSNDAALRMIAAKPLFGFGWSTFARESGGYYRQAPDYPLSQIRNVHNVYLGNAVELGLVGGGLWLTACAIVLIGAVMRRGPPSLRPWKIGLVAIALSYGIVGLTTPLGYAFPAVLAWTWAGLAWGED